MDTLTTNVASAVFMFPIAIAMAGNLAVNGMPFAITVMVGASCLHCYVRQEMHKNGQGLSTVNFPLNPSRRRER